MFDLLAIKVDGPAATAIGHLAIDWRLPDADEVARIELSNSTLHTTPGQTHAAPDATVTCDREGLEEMVATGATLVDLVDSGVATIDGDAARVLALWDTLTDFPLFYAIIEP